MSDSPARDTRILADLPRVQARERGDAPALVFGERVTTFAELDRASSRVAQALIAAGVGPGTRVAFLAKDSDHLFEAIFGTAKAGGVVMGINWRLAPGEIRYILNDGGAEVLLVGREFFPKVQAILGELESVRTVVALDGGHPEWPAFDGWRDAHEPVDPALPADPEDVVVQMYTSGTTGHPKGVQLPNRSFFAVVRSMKQHGDDWIGWRPDDVSLFNIPSFHIGGLWWAVTTLNAGARGIVMEAFVAWQALELIERHRVTKVCMVPAMIQVVLAEPACARTDLGSLEYLVYGGSPIPRPLLEKALPTFGCRFAQIYGLTETGNTAVCLRPEDHDDLESERLKAAGKPYPGVRLRCIDREGNELPPRAVGEVCIHSPANMIGYWNLPEATAATLRDGWIHTGDAGYLDEDGYVYIHDRVKDMIIYAGENIYPAEIESVLCGHPAVAEAAVIGIPDERWGEAVQAIVVLKEGASARPAQILGHVRRELADFKVPKSVAFADALPRTPSGKIKKAELRAPYWQGRERQVN